MIRRWLVRDCFLVLLLLWMGGWAMSHVYYGAVRCGTASMGGDAIRGRLYLRMDAAVTTPDWHMPQVILLPVRPLLIERAGHRVLGFGWGTSLFGVRFVACPFWFPTTLSACALLLVWRNTRPRLSPETAFPVELATKKEQS